MRLPTVIELATFPSRPMGAGARNGGRAGTAGGPGAEDDADPAPGVTMSTPYPA